MDRKIRVLCVPSDKGGCGLHRSLIPHQKLSELFPDDFDITIEYNPNWRDLDMVNKYDIIHVHKGLYQDMDGFRLAMKFCEDNNIVRILDIDDNWDVGKYHPLYHLHKNNPSQKFIKENLSLMDYVTTTTHLFEKQIKQFNKNTKIFPNALCPIEMGKLKVEKKCDKLRIGFIMGSSHEHDMELINGVVNKLPKDILNKIQIVLCGYDLRGTMTEILPDGRINQRPIKPEESVWYRYEKNVTDNYKIVSPQYHEFLLRFIPNIDYPFVENEHYKRCWTRTVDNYDYMKHYNELDVLLVPLQENNFNLCKSELKFVEAGMMNVAVVASNFGPYTIGSKNFFEKGGIVNEDGNCVLIDNNKSHKDWHKTIEKLVKNPRYVDILKKNMNKHVLDNYDINKITANRAEWYKTICKRNG